MVRALERICGRGVTRPLCADALEDTRRWLFSPWEWAALRQLLDTRAQVAASADALAVLPTPHVSALLRSRAATLDGWLVVPEAVRAP